jgi:hypothetical protein
MVCSGWEVWYVRTSQYLCPPASQHRSIQRIGAITRSANTNAAKELKALNIELYQLDVNKDREEDIIQNLRGVDILVSVVAAHAIESQRPLFKAAKAAGVKRVVPSDFSTPTDEGIMSLHDRVRHSVTCHRAW